MKTTKTDPEDKKKPPPDPPVPSVPRTYNITGTMRDENGLEQPFTATMEFGDP